MAEALATLEGEPIAIDQAEAAFAAAMAAPAADRPGMPAPARKPPEPAADPQTAPHGWTWTDGEWRPKKAPGRPRSADKARVTEAKPDAPKSTTKTPPAGSVPPRGSPAVDFSSVIKDVAETVWFGLATTPVPDQAFGYNLRGLRTRLRVQAAIVEENLDALAGGVAMVAKHNRFVQRACERLATGEGGLWVLPATTMLAPFVAATAQLWSGRLADENQLEQIAEATEANARVYLQQLLKAAPPAAPPAPE